MVILRNIDDSFLECSYSWFQDDDFLRSIDATPVTFDDQKVWFAQLNSRLDYWVKGVWFDDKWIGAVGLKRIAHNDVCKEKSAEYFGYIYPRELRRRGLGLQAYFKVEEFATNLGLQKIYLKVVEGNEAALAAYIKWGFEVDYVIEGEVNLIVMSKSNNKQHTVGKGNFL